MGLFPKIQRLAYRISLPIAFIALLMVIELGNIMFVFPAILYLTGLTTPTIESAYPIINNWFFDHVFLPVSAFLVITIGLAQFPDKPYTGANKNEQPRQTDNPVQDASIGNYFNSKPDSRFPDDNHPNLINTSFVHKHAPSCDSGVTSDREHSIAEGAPKKEVLND